jgi:hypothetical protein
MAFGNIVTDMDQASIGTYGYTVRINTVGIYAYDINFVQAQDDSASEKLSAPATASVTLQTLQEYQEDSSCPDIAFNYSHGLCTIFLKTATYPYTANTRVGLFGQRDSLKFYSNTDRADFPDGEMELFTAYVIKHAALITNKPIPHDVGRIIQRREYELSNGA